MQLELVKLSENTQHLVDRNELKGSNHELSDRTGASAKCGRQTTQKGFYTIPFFFARSVFAWNHKERSSGAARFNRQSLCACSLDMTGCCQKS